jgi:hypothetical protein
MPAYQRPKNLKDLLVRADVYPKTKALNQAISSSHKTAFLHSNSPSGHSNTRLTQQKSITDFFNQAPSHTIPRATLSEPNLTQRPSQVPKTSKHTCTSSLCRYCPLLNKTGQITCNATKQVYKSKYNISCKSSNLIYCCTTCGKQYVGQTKRKISDRFQAHMYNINMARLPSDKPSHLRATQDTIGSHFSSANHKGVSDLSIHVLDFISLPPNSQRALQLRLSVEKRPPWDSTSLINSSLWDTSRPSFPPTLILVLLYTQWGCLYLHIVCEIGQVPPVH